MNTKVEWLFKNGKRGKRHIEPHLLNQLLVLLHKFDAIEIVTSTRIHVNVWFVRIYNPIEGFTAHSISTNPKYGEF